VKQPPQWKINNARRGIESPLLTIALVVLLSSMAALSMAKWNTLGSEEAVRFAKLALGIPTLLIAIVSAVRAERRRS